MARAVTGWGGRPCSKRCGRWKGCFWCRPLGFLRDPPPRPKPKKKPNPLSRYGKRTRTRFTILIQTKGKSWAQYLPRSGDYYCTCDFMPKKKLCRGCHDVHRARREWDEDGKYRQWLADHPLSPPLIPLHTVAPPVIHLTPHVSRAVEKAFLHIPDDWGIPEI